MKFLRATSVILITLFVAEFAADNFLMHQSYFIYFLILVFIFIRITSWELKFYLFSMLILYPFKFPSGFPLPLKWWSELLALALFGILFVEILIAKKSLLSSKASIFLFAIGILILWSILHFIQNPVGGQTFGATKEEIGLRHYSIIVTGTCTFFVGFWFIRYKKINIERLLFIVLISALVISFIRIMGFSVPLLGKAFTEINVPEYIPKANRNYEITSGLRLTSLVGVSSVLGLYYRRKWGFFPVIAFVSSVMFSVLGAGRGIFWGIMFALGLYVIFIKRKHIFSVIALSIIIGIIFIFFLPGFDFAEFKYGRVFKIEGGVEEQDTSRYYNFLYMWEIFKKSPIMGKGIGFQPISYSDEFFDKHTEARELRYSIEDTIRGGSHGSYLSIASTFGLGGIFFILVIVYGTMYYSYKMVMRKYIDESESRLALFVFMYASIMSVHMVTGGDGTNYRDMWFIPGILAGIMSRDKLKKYTLKGRVKEDGEIYQLDNVSAQ